MQGSATIPDRAAILRGRLLGAIVSLVPAGLVVALCLPTLASRSLWLDEAWVAHVILNSTFEPSLSALNTTPIGWALLVKLVVLLFGSTEAWLRAVPLAFGAGAVAWTYLAAVNAVEDRLAGGIAAVLLATNMVALTFCKQVKPYTGDMFFACLIVVAAQRVLACPCLRRWLAFTAVGALAPFFSFTSLLVLPATAVAQLAPDVLQRPRTRLRYWLGAYVAIGAIFLAYWAGFLHGQRSSQLMAYWSSSFPPGWNPALVIKWAFTQAVLLAKYFFTPLGAFQAGIAVAGVWILIRRRPMQAVLLLGPVAVAIVAGVWRLYPFDAANGRILLFVLPGIVALTGIGLASALRAAAAAGPAWIAAGAIVALLVALPGFKTVAETLSGSPPAARDTNQEETRELVLALLFPHMQPGDIVYVYYGAAAAFQYYAPPLRQARLNFGEYRVTRYAGATIVFGGMHRDSPAQYAQELRSLLAGNHWRRVWLLFSHVNPNERRLLVYAVGPQGNPIYFSRPGAILYRFERN